MKTFILFALVATAAAWPKLPDCGTSQFPDAGEPQAYDSRIVGGWEVRQHELPYQTSLVTSTGSLFCGGSIIGTTQVLTAAHCTSGRTPSNTFVGVGGHTLNNQPPAYTRLSLSAINQHPGYNPSTISNDVSVLITSTTITWSDEMRGVCPPSRSGSNADVYAGETLIVSGWGTTSEGGSISNVLRAVDVISLTLEECRASSYPPSWIEDGMNCAGVDGGGKDACQGDSGGPMVFKEGSEFEEIGIVSWGQGCARPGYPGVYADCIYFESWIADNM
jgi:secreted trypsin-like serine protease